MRFLGLMFALNFAFSTPAFGAPDCSSWPNQTAPTFPETMTPELCDGMDTGSEWGSYERALALDSHNYYRAQLAHGCSQLPNNEYAPPGRNIRKFVRF